LGIFQKDQVGYAKYVRQWASSSGEAIGYFTALWSKKPPKLLMNSVDAAVVPSGPIGHFSVGAARDLNMAAGWGPNKRELVNLARQSAVCFFLE